MRLNAEPEGRLDAHKARLYPTVLIWLANRNRSLGTLAEPFCEAHRIQSGQRGRPDDDCSER